MPQDGSQMPLGERVRLLSAGQCDCLRLVGLCHSSKEVARQLGISPHTVDQRLKRAISILNVGSRAEAARLFMQFEGETSPPIANEDIYQDLVYQAPDFTAPADLSKFVAPVREADHRVGTESALYDFQERYFAARESRSKRVSVWSILLGDTYENKLGLGARLAIIIGLAVLAVVGFAVLVNAAEGLSRLR